MYISLNEAQLDAFASKGFLIIDEFLNQEIAATLLEECKYWQEAQAFKQAGVGKLLLHKIEENFRGDQIKWIIEDQALPSTKNYLNLLSNLMQQLSREFYLSLKDFECMYAVYPEGAFYKKHKDQFQQQAHRIISVVLYLNKDWQPENGGQLMLYLEDDEVEVKPLFNRLVFFRSELLHEVLPCNKTRYSLTAWMKDQLNEVNFL